MQNKYTISLRVNCERLASNNYHDTSCFPVDGSVHELFTLSLILFTLDSRINKGFIVSLYGGSGVESIFTLSSLQRLCVCLYGLRHDTL